MEKENSFEKLFNINVNERTEKKGRLTYLSWAWAWSEFKKVFPNATYKIKKNEQGLPYFYDANAGYMCFTEVSIGELTYEMWLPVMDSANKALKVATMFDINKTVMRCLTKNLAMFGLGLYIYAGEDLPESETDESERTQASSTSMQGSGSMYGGSQEYNGLYDENQTRAQPPTKPKQTISQATMDKVAELQIDLRKTARANKCEVDELTEALVLTAIEMKIAYLANESKNSGAKTNDGIKD